MSDRSRRPRLTVDVSPLFETAWTGIPMFTSRLIKALRRHGGVGLDFAYGLARLPPESVDSAILLGSGAALNAEFHSRAGSDLGPVAADQAILYPSVKGRMSRRLAREASTVHDLSTLFLPEAHEEANVAYHLDHFERELASDEAVFCISEATRAALAAAAPSAAPKARLVHQYVEWPASFELLERNMLPLRLGRYAVIVGTIEPRKNLELVIGALAHPDLERGDLRFIVIGKRGWGVEAMLAELPAPAQERLVFSGFVSEFAKYRLMKGAEFLVYPTLYEGFGIPALEAMNLGKPVLAALSSSLPDLVGDAGVYFDPLSIGEFAAALDEIADERRLAELAPKALARANLFTPERMAAPIVEWALG